MLAPRAYLITRSPNHVNIHCTQGHTEGGCPFSQGCRCPHLRNTHVCHANACANTRAQPHAHEYSFTHALDCVARCAAENQPNHNDNSSCCQPLELIPSRTHLHQPKSWAQPTDCARRAPIESGYVTECVTCVSHMSAIGKWGMAAQVYAHTTRDGAQQI